MRFTVDAQDGNTQRQQECYTLDTQALRWVGSMEYETRVTHSKAMTHPRYSIAKARPILSMFPTSIHHAWPPGKPFRLTHARAASVEISTTEANARSHSWTAMVLRGCSASKCMRAGGSLSSRKLEDCACAVGMQRIPHLMWLTLGPESQLLFSSILHQRLHLPSPTSRPVPRVNVISEDMLFESTMSSDCIA